MFLDVFSGSWAEPNYYWYGTPVEQLAAAGTDGKDRTENHFYEEKVSLLK